MARRSGRNHGKEQYWREILRQWRCSGQSVRGFCATHCLAVPSFYAWRQTIRQRDQQVRVPQAKALHDGTGKNINLPTFVPVTLAATATVAPLELLLPGGLVVRVPAGFDATTLKQVLAVLADEVSPC